MRNNKRWKHCLLINQDLVDHASMDAWTYISAINYFLILATHRFHVNYKKVLLRERKRHTARRVASARYADLSPDGGGGGRYRIQSLMGGGGVPHPVLDKGCTPSSPGWGDTPHLVLDAGYPIQSQWGVPQVYWSWMEYPPVSRMGVPPCPDLGWGSPPPPSNPDMGWGTPPPPV